MLFLQLLAFLQYHRALIGGSDIIVFQTIILNKFPVRRYVLKIWTLAFRILPHPNMLYFQDYFASPSMNRTVNFVRDKLDKVISPAA